MIPNQWYIVLESKEVRAGRPVGVLRMGERLVFWRDSRGQVVCQRDLCAHRGAALSRGKLLGDHIQCPFHGLEYDTSGRCQVIPANGRSAPVPERFRVHSYPAREAHGFVYIWWGQDSPRDLPPLPWFEDIDGTFTYGGTRDPWKTHYSRVIENQLDVPHVPFVHHNTIGRGNRTLIHGPRVEWVHDDLMFVYVWTQVDDGSRAKRPQEVPTDGSFRLEFYFPNLWQNHISENVRVVAAFVPVDEENTLLYLRFYQNFMRTPILRGLVNRLAVPFNLYVAHQDRPIVQTQLPKRPFVRIGENLFQGDGPIVAYRRRRQELRQQAGLED